MTSSEAFWQQARTAVDDLPRQAPPAWAFGATSEQADELLALVVAGVKTATSSALWDYHATDDPLPEVGDFAIVVDGGGNPRAVLQTTDVTVVRFDQVGADFAAAEGEGDRSLTYWRREHEWFWRQYSANRRGFESTMPVVCQRFRVVYRPESTPT